MKLIIKQDIDPESPRGISTVSTMACWHRRHTLGDEQPDCGPEDYREGLPTGSAIRPLHLMDHSGLSIQTTSFNDHWDSGMLGWAYVTPEKMKEEGLSWDEAMAAIEGEVKVYDQFIRGSVWAYVIRDTCDKCGQTVDEEVDSCYGFFGDDLEETGIKDHIPENLMAQLEAAWDSRM